MDLVTWNLNGLEDAKLDERTEAAITEILLGTDLMSVLESGRPPSLPDVIALQEVVDRTYRAHLVPHLKAAGFALVPPDPPGRGYFEVLAIRAPVDHARWVPFPRSGQGRALLEVRFRNGPTVMTAHLESLKPGAPVRLEQAAFVLDRLRASAPAVFLGDTNLREAEANGLDFTGIRDAFEAVGAPAGQRATWGRARYDRVWCTDDLRVTSFARLGTDDVPDLGEPPSDHFGLRVSISSPSDG